jgi:hypothetical protein
MSLRRLCFVLALLAPALLSGCGGPKMGRVKGCVTCNGKPVSQAQITFNPIGQSDKDKEPGKPGTGFTDDEGNYELSTYRSYDGALRGKHRVTVVLDDTNPARCPRKTEMVLEVGPGTNKLDIPLDK